VPLALPGVALAQGQGAPAGGAYDNADKQNAPVDKNAPMENKGAQPEGTTGVTPPEEKTPPAGSLDTSGTAKPSDKNVGGDINKTPETSEGSSGTSSTMKKTKKTIKKSTTDTNPSTDTTNPSNPSDVNR